MHVKRLLQSIKIIQRIKLIVYNLQQGKGNLQQQQTISSPFNTTHKTRYQRSRRGHHCDVLMRGYAYCVFRSKEIDTK